VDSRTHARRLIAIWVVLSVIGVLAVKFGLEPHMPPGNVSHQSADQVETNTVIAAIVTPIGIGVIVFFVYAAFAFRSTRGDEDDGPYTKGHGSVQRAWILVSTAIVLALAIYGTDELLSASAGIAGVGGGQGPTLIDSAPTGALQVQVIAQQWEFTYRYPQYGDIETTVLAIPVNRPVIFNVTSLDVVHSFWAYKLGVKIDAVPGTTNTAGTTATQAGIFEVRCAELCGLWHGAMANKGEVLNSAAFAAWVRVQQAHQPAPNTLPPHSKTYFPDPNDRAG
jgi:cytochrome c oxidase subunit II